MFGSDNIKTVVVALSETLTDAARSVHVFRAPVDLELMRLSVAVGEGNRAEGGTAIDSFENWGTGGSAAKSTGGSVMSAANLGGTVWGDLQVLSGTAFTEASMLEGEWLVFVYSPQASNAGSAVNPVIHIDYLPGAGFD
jgi:hypothetical protein